MKARRRQVAKGEALEDLTVDDLQDIRFFGNLTARNGTPTFKATLDQQKAGNRNPGEARRGTMKRQPAPVAPHVDEGDLVDRSDRDLSRAALIAYDMSQRQEVVTEPSIFFLEYAR